MVKNAEKIIAAIVVLLAIDLWGVHAKLLYQLNPDKIGDAAKTFSYIAMNENTITAMLFSLVFAFVPVLVLTTISPKLEHYWLFVMIFAFFDGGAWFIYYNKTAIANFSSYGAGYYGLFIVFIVASIGFIRMRIDELNDESNNHQIKISEKTVKRIKDKSIQQVIDISKDKIEKENTKGLIDIKSTVYNKKLKDSFSEEKFIELLNSGISQSEMAQKLNWHPSKVSRTKSKLIINGKYKSE